MNRKLKKVIFFAIAFFSGIPVGANSFISAETAVTAVVAGALGYGISAWHHKKPFKTTIQFTKSSNGSILVQVLEGKTRIYQFAGSYAQLQNNAIGNALIDLSKEAFGENLLIKPQPFAQKLPYEKITFEQLMREAGISPEVYQAELERNGLFKVGIIQKGAKFTVMLSFAGEQIGMHAHTVQNLNICPMCKALSEELIDQLIANKDSSEITEYDEYFPACAAPLRSINPLLTMKSNAWYSITFPSLGIFLTI